MSFLSIWSFGANSWKFKPGAENPRKSVFRNYMERFSLQMLQMLENGSLLGPVSWKLLEMASARQKKNFLSMWSFGPNSWKFKPGAEHARKFVFRNYLERLSLQMLKMLETSNRLRHVNWKCLEITSARQKISFLSIWSFGPNSWKFKPGAENPRKSVFRNYMERFSLQMLKMLEDGSLLASVRRQT